MRSDTRAVRLNTDRATAFDFIANPQNLPTWAVGFCRGIRRDGASWIVTTASGEFPIEIDGDPQRGTIDFHMRPAPDVKASAYSRLIECADGCDYVFTQFCAPGTPDAVFEANVESLKEELIVLRSVLRARHVCPA